MSFDIRVEANDKFERLMTALKESGKTEKYEDCWKDGNEIYCLIDIRDTRGGGIKGEIWKVEDKDEFYKGKEFRGKKTGEMYISPTGRVVKFPHFPRDVLREVGRE